LIASYSSTLTKAPTPYFTTPGGLLLSDMLLSTCYEKPNRKSSLHRFCVATNSWSMWGFSVVPEEFEDTNGVIKICNSKKDRHHNDQTKKDKRTNNNLQNITHKSKDRITRTPLKTGGEHRCAGKVNSTCSTSGTHVSNIILTSLFS